MISFSRPTIYRSPYDIFFKNIIIGGLENRVTISESPPHSSKTIKSTRIRINPDQGTFYKITDPDSSKVSMSYKTKTDRGVVID